MSYSTRVVSPEREAYESEPKKCKRSACSTRIPWAKRKQDFCCQRCAALEQSANAPPRGKRRVCTCGKPRGRNKWCQDCIELGRHVHMRRESLDGALTDHSRKAYLLRTRPHACEMCGTAAWLGKPVPLVMDHIDGNAENNAETNLRLICRNCDGLLPTFAGRNRGRGRKARRDRYKPVDKS